MELKTKSPLRAPSTPSGALTAAAVAAILAGILVFSALRAAKGSDKPVSAAPAKVFVADRMIPKGSTAEAIATGSATRRASVASSALVSGAVTDISQLRDKVATHDILPGQQLAAGDFAVPDKKTLANQLSRDLRAVSIPLDASHGMIGDAHAGDRVDVYASFYSSSGDNPDRAVLKPLGVNMLVLKAPKKAKGGVGGNANSVITLRAPSRLAAKIAFSSDNGKLWIALRPAAGAPGVKGSIVTLSEVLGSGGYLIVKQQNPQQNSNDQGTSK